MKKEAKQTVLLAVIVLLLTMTVTSVFFPSRELFSIRSMGKWDGVLEETGNNKNVIQQFNLQNYAKKIHVLLTPVETEISRGRVLAVVTDLNSGEILHQEELQVKRTTDDQEWEISVELEPGKYQLSLTPTDFDPDIPVFFYQATPDRNLKVCYVDGVRQNAAVHLLFEMGGNPKLQFPTLALPIFAIIFLYLLITRKKMLLIRMLAAVLLCAGTCVITAFLPIATVKAHYPLMILEFGVFLWVFQKEFRQVDFPAIIYKYGKTALISLCLFLASVGIGFAAEYLTAAAQHRPMIVFRTIYWTALAFPILMHLVFWRALREHPEWSFALAALSVGICMIMVLPVHPYDWDEQIHYYNTFFLEQGKHSHLSEADFWYYNIWTDGSFEVPKYIEHLQHMEDGSISFRLMHESSAWTFGMLGYFHLVVGRWLAKILCMSFVGMYRLPKIVSLAFYVSCVFFAMRRVKSGKYLLYVIGMLPTNMFQACSYSYDIWVTSWAILGFGYLIGAMQRTDEYLTAKEMAVILLSLSVACFPKAVYAPMIMIVLLMPKCKFPTEKAYRRYLLAGVMTTLFTLATYFVPFVMRGAFESSGDYRGGDSVNSVNQVKFIFTQPLTYTRILLKFLSGYLSPERATGYTCYYAYLGDGNLRTTCMTLLFTTALIDRNASDRIYRKFYNKLVAGFFLFGSVVLTATALYISFTPVANPTINGCQPRYLLPLLYPAYAFLGNLTDGEKLEKTAVPDIIRVVSCYVAFTMLFTNIISRFTY